MKTWNWEIHAELILFKAFSILALFDSFNEYSNLNYILAKIQNLAFSV